MLSKTSARRWTASSSGPPSTNISVAVPGVPAVVFCVDVKHSQDVAKAFRRRWREGRSTSTAKRPPASAGARLRALLMEASRSFAIAT